MSFAVLRPRVVANVRDSASVLIVPDEYDAALTAGVARYSRVHAREIVADIAGDGSFDYPLPAEWTPGISRLLLVEYPAGEREPSYVDRLDYLVYESPAGPVLRFRSASPQIGETIRITFKGPHTIAEADTSVPAAEHDVVVLVASALACEQLASHYSNTGDSSINADTVDHKSKANDYAKRARRFAELANELLPNAIGDVGPAGGETSWGDSMGLLTHPRR